MPLFIGLNPNPETLNELSTSFAQTMLELEIPVSATIDTPKKSKNTSLLKYVGVRKALEFIPKMQKIVQKCKTLRRSVQYLRTKNAKLQRKLVSFSKEEVLEEITNTLDPNLANFIKTQLLQSANSILFEALKTKCAKLSDKDKLCTLIFDEMAIEANISFNGMDFMGFEDYSNYINC
ncbi:hypothetical protein ABEB36_013751 [Hypothenemus hampei]|uniref:Transposable element P transposase-like RNase H domain-containing protein n=1 Tax=Hypothenemus hampei TaxID=57062 RepID=A0ABD1E561_HYPHA